MAKYDPSKQYQWKEDDEFVMNGNQYGLILNAFRQFLSSQKVQETMLIVKAEAEMTNILKEGVESGMVTEMVQPGQAPAPQVNSKGKPKAKMTKA